MPHWIRVFGTNDRTPAAGELITHLLRFGFMLESEVIGDDGEWEQVLLCCEPGSKPVMLERMALDESELAEEVQPVLEELADRSASAERDRVVGVLRNARQIFIVGTPPGATAKSNSGRLTQLLCGTLATWTEGLYEVSDDGFYDAQGKRVLQSK